VILLNDDALLETPGGFSAMQKEWYAHPSYGLISATTNLAGNPAQNPRRGRLGSPLRICPSPTPGNSFATVAFVCVFIPRATLGVVGMLDERFVAYGWEDNDYCRRVNKAGMLIGIFDGCFVDHSTLHSTFRGDAYAAGDINAGRAIYLEKWGSM
jgi:GT2 family glycosyltransferase